jgi:tetratricopeptide (TPR) repeat protein
MKIRTVLYAIVALLIGIALIGKFFPRKNIVQKVEDLRVETSAQMDSFNNFQERQYKYFRHIEQLIDSNKLKEADSIVSATLKENPNNEQFLTYKGQIFEAQKKYDSAMIEYNLALIKNSYSSAIEKKANLFIKLKQYNKAIEDYKTIVEYNSYYTKQLAAAFSLNKQKDSALKYYRIYLEHYPKDSITILSKIKSL